MRTMIAVGVMLALVVTPLLAQEVEQRDFGAAMHSQQLQERVEQFKQMGMDEDQAMFMAMITSGQMDPTQALLMMMMMDGGGGNGDAMGLFMLMNAMKQGTSPPQPVVIDREGIFWALIVEGGVLYKINLDTMEVAGAVPYAQAGRNGQAMYMMMPMFEDLRKKAQQPTCLSNLKQLGLAALQWAQDHNETLPPAEWVAELEPYHKNAAILVCPSRPELTVGYALNVKLVGVALGDITNPAETIMFFESNVGGDNPVGGPELVPEEGVHNGGVNVIFVDGHAQWVSVEKARDLLGQPVF